MPTVARRKIIIVEVKTILIFLHTHQNLLRIKNVLQHLVFPLKESLLHSKFNLDKNLFLSKLS